MTQRFAQLSDLHLSSLDGVSLPQLLSKRLLGYLSWRRKRRFEHRLEVLEALLRDMDTAALSQVLVTGDLTHVGLPGEFAEARAWLARLGPADQVALVPGNHDACVATPWSESYAMWEEYMASDPGGSSSPRSPHFPSLRIRGDIAFIGLSSACPTAPLMATGLVDQEQLDALPDVLDSTGDRGLFRVIYLHHSPVPGQEKWRKRLLNAGRVARIISQHGAELVLHGHGHRARQDSLAGDAGSVPVIAVPSASALGLHGADVAAYNCYQVQRAPAGWKLDIQTRQYDPEGQLFRAGRAISFSLERA
jgi:3',5'-cyclic AMP phosphodiesterase CpdA